VLWVAGTNQKSQEHWVTEREKTSEKAWFPDILEQRSIIARRIHGMPRSKAVYRLRCGGCRPSRFRWFKPLEQEYGFMKRHREDSNFLHSSFLLRLFCLHVILARGGASKGLKCATERRFSRPATVAVDEAALSLLVLLLLTPTFSYSALLQQHLCSYTIPPSKLSRLRPCCLISRGQWRCCSALHVLSLLFPQSRSDSLLGKSCI